MCGEVALAITAALLKRFLLMLLDKTHVGIASEKAHRVNITLTRITQNVATLSTMIFNSPSTRVMARLKFADD